MIIPLMAAELYGVAILGRVMGIVLTADSVSESLVPMLVASMRDTTGSYTSGFLVLVVLAAIGAGGGGHAAAIGSAPNVAVKTAAPGVKRSRASHRRGRGDRRVNLENPKPRRSRRALR